MAEGPPPEPSKRPDVPPAQLGGDRMSGQLGGIAPAVISAFFKKSPGPAPWDPEAPKPPAEIEHLERPRNPPGLGHMPGLDPEAVRNRDLKIQHLAMMMAARGPASAPPAAGVRPPAVAPDDLRARHLELRARGGAGHKQTGLLSHRHTGDLTAPGRGRVEPPSGRPATGGGPQPPARSLGTGRLEHLVAGALGADGVLALRQAVSLLEDKELPGRLSGLTAHVTALVPGDDGVVKLGADVGKRLIVNNLNPLLALSVAARESAAELENLKRWEALTPKERLVSTANLTANLAEIVGAVTPPPVNFGAQLAAAGLQLVSLATEHGETLEDVATKAAQVTQTQPARRVISELNDHGAVIAHRVSAAWGELQGRLKQPPRAPEVLQRLFDSRGYQRLKRHPVTRSLARSAENLTYNLTQRWRNFKEVVSYRLGKQPGPPGE